MKTGAWLLAVALPVLLGPSPAAAVDLDLDTIFRCTKSPLADAKACATARDMILNNCTSCHTFAPIVMQQFDAAAWQGLLDRHQPRVPQFSAAQVKLLHGYLAANFNETLDPPELPEALMKTWTAY